MAITEIRVKYHFAAPKEMEDKVMRALETHPTGCPAYVTVNKALRIVIDWDVDWQ